MKVLLTLILIALQKAVSGQLLSCGDPVVGHYGKSTTLECNTTSQIVELNWGVKSGENPFPALIFIDPGGEQPGANLASSNYVDRVFFVGNLATGNASIKILNLTASDSREYLWKIDHGRGEGYKKYTMSLSVIESTTKAVPTTSPSPASSTNTSITGNGNTPSSITTPTSTSTPKSHQGLSSGGKAGIGVGAGFAATGFGILAYVGYKKFIKKNEPGNHPADKKEDTEMNSPPAVNA